MGEIRLTPDVARFIAKLTQEEFTIIKSLYGEDDERTEQNGRATYRKNGLLRYSQPPRNSLNE
ncbi:MAG: hypothetical protein BHV93_04420 [Clostridiales bacterium 52_15]|nr:MAG: hypothetical protein BHV93_04420 [Clostridiales bacterium 52_15]